MKDDFIQKDFDQKVAKSSKGSTDGLPEPSEPYSEIHRAAQSESGGEELKDYLKQFENGPYNKKESMQVKLDDIVPSSRGEKSLNFNSGQFPESRASHFHPGSDIDLDEIKEKVLILAKHEFKYFVSNFVKTNINSNQRKFHKSDLTQKGTLSHPHITHFFR